MPVIAFRVHISAIILFDYVLQSVSLCRVVVLDVRKITVPADAVLAMEFRGHHTELLTVASGGMVVDDSETGTMVRTFPKQTACRARSRPRANTGKSIIARVPTTRDRIKTSDGAIGLRRLAGISPSAFTSWFAVRPCPLFPRGSQIQQKGVSATRAVNQTVAQTRGASTPLGRKSAMPSRDPCPTQLPPMCYNTNGVGRASAVVRLRAGG